MYWVIMVIIVIITLILSYACANTFYEIASMKGHDEGKYFWWTFFVPLLGALMVIALPDRVSAKARLAAEDSSPHRKEESPLHVPTAVPSIPPTVDVPEAEHPVSPMMVTPRATGIEAQIECPVCGKLQKADRTVCWKCGAKFNKE